MTVFRSGRYHTGDITYMVYYHKGEIKCKRGIKEACGKGNFYPVEGATQTYMTKNPREPMKVNSRGKVWVLSAEDIPAAVEMIREQYKEKLVDYKEASGAVIRNFQQVEAQK